MDEGRSVIRRFGPFVGGAVLLIAAVVVVLVLTLGGDDTAPAFSAEELNETPNGDWVTNGGALHNQSYSELDEIGTENVGDLEEAWHINLGSGDEDKHGQQGTPIVHDGQMYITTGDSDVFALDATNGEIEWSYEANIDDELDTACCGWNNRGVALGDGKVFHQRLDGDVVALDQETGEVEWQITNLRWQEGYAPTSAPLYYDGKVYVGSAGGEFGSRGSLTALNADSGVREWRFYTVPEPGEIGGSTWTPGRGGFSYQTGGAAVWQTPSVDPETDTLVFTTSNAAPWNLRGEGDNLFSSSFVALDPGTGQYKWHYQVVHHDIWDYDCPSPTVMFDMEVDGEMRHAVAEACKTGFVYVLDRETGEPLLPIEEVEVPQSNFQNTAATQPEPEGDRFSPRCAREQAWMEDGEPVDGPDGNPVEVGCLWDPFEDDRFVALAPHAQGGQNWHPTAYYPGSNYLYTCSADSDISYKAESPSALEYSPGESFIGLEFGDGHMYGGRFTAMDMSTNEIAWQHEYDQPCYSGSFTTAGGLVFTGKVDGTYLAYDAESGDELWSTQLDAFPTARGITYEVDGEQYVAVLAGGVTFTQFYPGEHGDDLYAFKLP